MSNTFTSPVSERGRDRIRPALPVDAYVRYSRLLGVEPSTPEGHELAELPQFYADMFGWEGKAAAVAEVLGGERGDLERRFESVEVAGVAACDLCIPYERDLPIHVCRRLRLPVEELWPQTRHYD